MTNSGFFYNKRRLLQLKGIYAAILFTCINLQGQNTRPNIIVMMSDDHAAKAISAYGSDLIKTPHIDEIAKEGILMRNAFVTNSICSPSRAVLLTGQYSHLNGVTGNLDGFKEGMRFLPEILLENGYTTGIVGKWHIKSKPTGFDYSNILPGQGDYYNPGFIKNGKDTIYSGYVTDITADLALKWIDQVKDKKQPFFLMVQQKAPHRNWMPPLENLELFNDRKFELPSNFFDDYAGRAALAQQKISITGGDLYIDADSKVPCDTCGTKRKKQWFPQHYRKAIKRLNPEERKAWKKAYQKEYEEFESIENREQLVRWQFQRYMEDYLRCVKSVDDNVGKILNYLDNHELAENTLIIYTSDQGFFLGEHGLYDKRFMYEESYKTPMIVRYPKMIEPNQRMDDLALNLDLAPTLINFAGIQVPPEMQGVSMKNLWTGKKVNWRDNIYYHYFDKKWGLNSHYGIRNERFKLIHFYDPLDTWELYDLKEDPKEMNNLYDDPEYTNLIKDLKNELKSLQVKFKVSL